MYVGAHFIKGFMVISYCVCQVMLFYIDVFEANWKYGWKVPSPVLITLITLQTWKFEPGGGRGIISHIGYTRCWLQSEKLLDVPKPQVAVLKTGALLPSEMTR